MINNDAIQEINEAIDEVVAVLLACAITNYVIHYFVGGKYDED